MNKGVATFVIIIALIVGFAGGYFGRPYIKGFKRGYSEVNFRMKEASVKVNMHTFQTAIEGYEVDSGYYPKNSDVSWAKEELPRNFENPYTGEKGAGGAYISGEPRESGIIGYESNPEGTEYKIQGYGVDLILTDKDMESQ